MPKRGNLPAIILLVVVLISFAPACVTGTRAVAADNANQLCGYWCTLTPAPTEAAYCECARSCLDTLEPEAQ